MARQSLRFIPMESTHDPRNHIGKYVRKQFLSEKDFEKQQQEFIFDESGIAVGATSKLSA